MRRLPYTPIASLPIIAILATAAHATTYYVDSSAPEGSDSGPGTLAAPWQSLNKVNATTFSPGDTILLKKDSKWSGQALHPRGSGTAGHPIKIDMYGRGQNKPKIDGNGVNKACECSEPQVHPIHGAVYLYDQDYWEIRNLEVTNKYEEPGSVCTMVGISARNSRNHPDAKHIYIGNNTVHDVTGYVAGVYGNNAGIAITSDMNTADPCPTWPSACPANPVWDDVTIENNTIYNVDRIAVFVGGEWPYPGGLDSQSLFPRRISHVNIRNNELHDIGGDGILTTHSIYVTIENNVLHDSGSKIAGFANATGIWTALTSYSVIQYNEVYRYGIGASGDGEAFNADWGTMHQIIQYNYSHDNPKGFLMICEVDPPGGPIAITNLRVRYNISYNDGTGAFRFDCSTGTFPHGSDGVDINNNLIYLSQASNNVRVFYWGGDPVGPSDGAAYIYNNIFYAATGAVMTFPPWTSCAAGGQCFANNVYFGTVSGTPPPDYVAANTFDPRLVNPTSPGIGRATTDGLKLKAGSPALGSGYAPGWGIDTQSNLGPFDFWGNPVAAPNIAPNRGPYNGAGL